LNQIAQVAGALLVLAGFALSQFQILSMRSVPYLVLNLAGSTLLTLTAVLDRQWGFLLLNAVWAAVSLITLGRVTLASNPSEITGEP
jgi:hypothetical protein